MVLVLDFGGKSDHLTARRIRDQHIYCEVHPGNLPIERMRSMQPKGIVFTGVPSGHQADCDPGVFTLGVPVLKEVPEGERGDGVLRTFLTDTCGLGGDWDIAANVESLTAALRAEVGDRRVLLGLSGGVDSSVTAALLHKAIGDKLVCIFVDHGFMRYNEPDLVEQVFQPRLGAGFFRVDARERFFARLAGVVDPEEKRRRVGEEFIRVFEDEARKLGKVECFAQGTIYPDIIESGTNGKGVIKSHHNVGGLPERMDFESIVEPVKLLFKDEVRTLGRALGLPAEMVDRQPFPGPGLAVRVIGEVTPERVALLQKADAIFRAEIEAAGIPADQYFAIMTANRAVGVVNETRTYGAVVALRAIATKDFMTAECVDLPMSFLRRVSDRIIQEVPGIGRVVHDITNKPPATIEWE